MHGPRHVNESRCGLRVTRDAFFHTKNDTEFAGLALYLSKAPNARSERRVFSETQTVCLLPDGTAHVLFVYTTVKDAVQPTPDFRVRLWKNEEKGERMKFQNGVSFCLPKNVYDDLQRVSDDQASPIARQNGGMHYAHRRYSDSGRAPEYI